MKYVLVLGDGMADYPVKELDNKTPLQYANIPTFDYLAQHGELGLVKTIPEGMPTGSDTANLAVMGYDPAKYYSGRSPFEAASMGVEMKDSDVTFRCNLVTLSEEEVYENKIMLDHSADEISTEEARELIKTVSEHLRREGVSFYPGVSYRHLMVWAEAPYDYKLVPPHDIIGQEISGHLPEGCNKEIILEMMKKSSEFLKDHPVNLERKKKGLRPANSIWIWGEGKKPLLSSFEEKYGIRGAVISAVDLIKGLGVCAGMEVVEVEGATGNIHTNFEGKARAAVEVLKRGADFVYVHIEAPDECGHRYEIENKVKAIEYVDGRVTKYIKKQLDFMGEPYKLMVLPDHPTPLSLRTHTRDAVPYVIYKSYDCKSNEGFTYDESSAGLTGNYIAEGYKLMDKFIFE
jgi:2,3-bisphosphoglycerate-independent phosphoglycerate mutase